MILTHQKKKKKRLMKKNLLDLQSRAGFEHAAIGQERGRRKKAFPGEGSAWKKGTEDGKGRCVTGA